MKKTPETDGQSEIRSFAFEKISGSHQSRNQKRNIYDHEEYDDQSDQIWNNRFGNPLDRKSRDTGSNKQVDGNRANIKYTTEPDSPGFERVFKSP